MDVPPAFPDQSRARQVAGAVVGPILLGVVAGVVLGHSATGYWVVQVAAALGGIGAGFDHRGARPGAQRGLAGGVQYAGSLLVVRALTGRADQVDLGNPGVAFVAIVVISIALGAVGGTVRARVHGDHAAGAAGR